MSTAEETLAGLLEMILLAYDAAKPDAKVVCAAMKQVLEEFETATRNSQDKITRHACADAVNALVGNMDDGTQIDRIDAHAACMNVKAV